MPVSPGIGLTILTLAVSFLILAVSAWNLYLSHYREQRSTVNLLPEDRDTKPGFGGGNHAIDDSSFWNGSFYLKITNTGAKSAYIRDFTHSLAGLKKNGEVHSPEGAMIDVSRTTSNWAGKEIEPHSTKRYRLRVRISPEKDIGILVNHDSAIVQHTLEVEDNKGSYEVTHKTEIELVGPDGALENWEEHQKE